MNGYESDLYEPLLDQFWDTKDKMGVDKALDIFMKDFSRSLFVERYHCKGTQLNQILICKYPLFLYELGSKRGAGDRSFFCFIIIFSTFYALANFYIL